ncbi:unnamed protein product [Effrenium voratum]|uniref:Uncharacterized protein n=1 Tax=Effrenium voratum TaxID=2562239 RepID=A0AA36NDU6_9DINO|nr:unnamed protein product [Effrenium voratum]
MAGWDAAPAPRPMGGGYNAAPAPAPLAPAPPGRLQVYSEDCEGPVVSGQSPTNVSRSPARISTRQEFYVQDLRDNRRFRPVSRKALHEKTGKRDREGDTSRSKRITSLGRENLMLLDPDAAELLLLEPEDAAVAELLAGAWQCQVFASVCCATCQALLGGLSIANLLLALALSEELLRLSEKLWPYLGVFLMLAEAATLGSFLGLARALWIMQVSRGTDEQISGARRHSAVRMHLSQRPCGCAVSFR